jgi:hypothetical protein
MRLDELMVMATGTPFSEKEEAGIGKVNHLCTF